MAGPKNIPINLNDPEIINDFRALLDRRQSGSLKESAADKKIKERIGERNALNRIRRRFPGTVPIAVPARRNGVPVLDLLLVNDEGKFVFIEAKFSTTGEVRLGKTNTRMFVGTASGDFVEVPIKKGTRQMSPRWIEDRILELDKLGKNNREIRRLSGRLKQALFSENFEAYTVVTDRTGEVRQIVDHTKEWRASFGSRGIQIRPQSPTGSQTAALTPNLIRQRGTTTPLSSSAVKRGAGRVARRGALRTAGRFLVSALGRTILIALPILDALGWVLLAVEVYEAIVGYYREKAIQEAFLKGLEKDIPNAIRRNLKAHRNRIARHYVSEWERAGGNRVVFLYISPRVEIYNAAKAGESYNFKVKLDVKNLLRDFITAKRIDFEREDIDTLMEDSYWIALRWSVAQPLFTPFDIYLARIQMIAKLVVDEWYRLYLGERPVDTQLARAFHAVVEECARITVVLRSDAYFGFDPGEGQYTEAKAGFERQAALRRLGARIHKRLIPRLDILMQRHPIDPESRLVVVTSEGDPLSQEVELQLGGGDLVVGLQEMADQMKGYNGSELEYLRFETLEAMRNPNRMAAHLAHLGADGHVPDLTEFLTPVLEFLPEDLRPSPTLSDFFGGATGAGEVQIERFE